MFEGVLDGSHTFFILAPPYDVGIGFQPEKPPVER